MVFLTLSAKSPNCFILWIHKFYSNLDFKDALRYLSIQTLISSKAETEIFITYPGSGIALLPNK